MEYSRREMLKLTGLGLAGLLGCEAKAVEETKACALAREYPNSEFARVIERVPVPNSVKCLVHVRQQHSVEATAFEKFIVPSFANPEKRTQWQKTYAGINTCQKEISDMLSIAAKRYVGNVSFFAEGGHGKVSVREAREAYALTLQRIDNSKLFEFPILDRILEYQSLSQKKQSMEEHLRFLQVQEQIDTIKYIPGGDLFLAKDGIISLQGAETEEGSRIAREKILSSPDPKNPPKEVLQEVNTIRENAVLSLVEKSSSMINFVTFGAVHQLGKTVQEWNKTHACVYSFVSVTPNSCEK